MSKFKFGYKVIHREYGAGVVVKEVALYSNVPVIFDGDLNTRWIASYDLKPIPHPDTERLDWLEKQMIEDSPEVIISDGYGRFCTMKDFTAAHIPTFETIRDAIDFSISEEQADD